MLYEMETGDLSAKNGGTDCAFNYFFCHQKERDGGENKTKNMKINDYRHHSN